MLLIAVRRVIAYNLRLYIIIFVRMGNDMPDANWTRRHAALSLARLWPRLEQHFGAAPPDDWRAFETRLCGEWERLFDLLVRLYGQHYDFFYHL